MKIDFSVKASNVFTAKDAQSVAHRMTHAVYLVVDSLSKSDAQPGTETDFVVRLTENPYLDKLLRASKASTASVIEDVAAELREYLSAAGVQVEIIYAQANPQGNNAHSDTVFLTL